MIQPRVTFKCIKYNFDIFEWRLKKYNFLRKDLLANTEKATNSLNRMNSLTVGTTTQWLRGAK